MFYDLLLLDNTVCMKKAHDERRQRLHSIIQCLPGRADIRSWETINFSSRYASDMLLKAFARAIIRGWEGFVLKGREDPFFLTFGGNQFLKLKD
jgi:DNA ligase 4